MKYFDKDGNQITLGEWSTIRDDTPDEYFETKGKGVVVIITKTFNGLENNIWQISVYDNNKAEDFIRFFNCEIDADFEVGRVITCFENGVEL